MEGEDVEARDREGVRHRLPRQRAAEGLPVPERPGRKHRQGDDSRDDDQTDELRGRRVVLGYEHDDQHPGEGQPGRFVPGQGRQPEHQAQTQQTGVGRSRAARVPNQAAHEEASTKDHRRE